MIDGKRGREQIWKANRERECLIRREKLWDVGGEGEIIVGKYERKETNCDCGIRERTKKQRGRRRERGMTYRGRRTED